MTKCMFCDNQGVTKEHMWGRWLYERSVRVNHPSIQKIRPSHVISSNSEGGSKLKNGIFSRPGHPLGMTSKAVCRECNNGWMNHIEDEMKSSYERIYCRLGSPVIKPKHLRRVANWTYLKMCLFERAYPTHHIADGPSTAELQSWREERWAQFRDTKVCPPSFRGWLGTAVPGAPPFHRRQLGAHSMNTAKVMYADELGVSETVWTTSIILVSMPMFLILTNIRSQHHEGNLQLNQNPHMFVQLDLADRRRRHEFSTKVSDLDHLYRNLFPPDIAAKIRPITYSIPRDGRPGD